MSDRPDQSSQPVTGLVVRPGDTLIIGMSDRSLTKEQAARIIATANDACPGLAEVLVLGGVAALAAYRPEAVA